MGIPKNGLRREQLQDLTAGNAVIDGSHTIIQVNFIEKGVKKTGYLKELEPKRHFPELLAKISRAASLLHRSYMGNNAADERLVFDNNDKLVGILSIALDGFKPFNYASDAIPTDPIVKEQVIPSTKTLLENDFIPAAFAYWFGDNDDGHPKNNGFAKIKLTRKAVILDYDMFFYWFTILMKEARPVIGTPKKRIALTVRDWEMFPHVQDSKPYHWCTYQHPGKVTLPVVLPLQGALITHSQFLPKQYADPGQFERLAQEYEAHEQKFAVAMKALLSFQPEVIRARLVEAFGDMPLNYTSLEETDINLRIAYEKEYPTLCNEETNTQLFVDFIMNLYQQHYDNLYKVVVFYMGCPNNGFGVSLKATCTDLYRKPSVFKNIVTWMNEENETTYSKEEVAVQYDLVQLQKRYHQIWRDAYAPTLKDLLYCCYQLRNKELKDATSVVDLEEVKGKLATDDSLTSAWELIGSMPELSIDKIKSYICVDAKSKLRDGALLLVEFTQQFHAIAKIYYEKERKDLIEEDNLIFTTELKKLYEKYDQSLREALSHTSSNAKEYNRIASLLEQFMFQVSFRRHLTTTDEQMKDTMTTTVAKEVLPHTHEEVIAQYIDSLFLWAKSVKPENLTNYINDIIDVHYKPFLQTLSSRQRAQPVKDYLLSSQSDSGSNRLAYIFSSGNEETGALNMSLIEHLTPLMLQTYPLQSVRDAIRTDSFNKTLMQYTKAVVAFSKNDKGFLHLYNTDGIQTFYNTIYNWIESLPQERFKGIINSALADYEKGLWLGTSRREEVKGYFHTSSNQAQIAALIFLKGQDSSTLNSILLQKIVAGMKSEIRQNIQKLLIPENQLIMQYNHVEHTNVYGMLKIYAVAPSHRQNRIMGNTLTA